MAITLPRQHWRPGLAPGVYEAPPVRAGGAVARLDRAAFIGLAERGPLHTPVDVADWSDFQRLFGGAPPGLLLPRAVRLFFANGSRRWGSSSALTRSTPRSSCFWAPPAFWPYYSPAPAWLTRYR
ncbi:hypothetical protein, partial [Synechococcus sp. BA-132 BA5]|uniref:hypothetical protein n=1 Tax=Synechococcus sp. BA-132 BA5 TaxID=3110252 RepID=UPI002B1F7B08